MVQLVLYTTLFHKLGTMTNSHTGIFVSNIGFHALVSTLFHNLGIKVYKHGIMIGSNIGIFVSNIGFHALISTLFHNLGSNFISLGP